MCTSSISRLCKQLFSMVLPLRTPTSKVDSSCCCISLLMLSIASFLLYFLPFLSLPLPSFLFLSFFPSLSLFLSCLSYSFSISLFRPPSLSPSLPPSFLFNLRADILWLLVPSTWIHGCASLWCIKISCPPKLKIPRAVPIFQMEKPSSSTTLAQYDSDSMKNYGFQPNIDMRHVPREDFPDWWQVRQLKR